MNDDDKFREVFGGAKGGLEDFGRLDQGVTLLLSRLGDLGGKPIIAGDEVEFHEGRKIILPHGMSFERAYEILKRLERDSETVTDFDRKFHYRPDDGAYATLQVLRARYGMVLGETRESMFGTRPAQTRTITIGVNKTIQVPWGLISIPTLPGLELILCDQHPDPEYGRVFELHVTGPRKYKDEVQAIFEDIEEHLRTKSIYRGQALIGADRLDFLDLSSFKSDQVVYSDEVMAILEDIVWSAIRYSGSFREEGISLKRSALLYGPYGTGKTSAGLLTALEAVQHGVTFLSAKPGRDSIEAVLQTARLYQPAVVFIEDVDGETNNGDPEVASRLLDAFDGITAKGGEIIMVLTTNHIKRIPQGMLRPGRLDAIIEISELDRGGVERLVRAVVPTHKLDAGVDFDEVYGAMTGFLPAFVRETITRAATIAISRLKGQREYLLTTVDLVKAATSLHAQLKLLNEATEGEKMPTLDGAIRDSVQKAFHGSKVVSPYGDESVVMAGSLNGAHA